MAKRDSSPMTLADSRPPSGEAVGDPLGPVLPQPRGPVSAWLLDRLRRPVPSSTSDEPEPLPPCLASTDAVVAEEDRQLSLYVLYELSYRGFIGVDERWEHQPCLQQLRRVLEQEFERRLRERVDELGLIAGVRDVAEVLARCESPSLSTFLLEEGTAEQFREFCQHRSAYQLKEADPHSWAIPRFSGPRKAALITIQADEYGNGVPGRSHAELFAAALRSLDLDDGYGAYLDRLPAVTLATTNLISMFGLQFRLRGAVLGHLAGFEMTSVTPMGRYSKLAKKLGLGEAVQAFYDVHVDADEMHGLLASEVLVGGDLRADGLDPEDVYFGAAALALVEADLTEHLLAAWRDGRTSLRDLDG